ncbi:TIGR03619 family F420-dependent LLM class oxidoreductase [Pseudofrankia asymbiotica]|uniref:Luciferase-like domain-containing protein n=1 Tax=Pseudofrankia asymbiotica TaxID=1834516 RepID=A0A1V2I1B6_9ACTN|nr:TIGR03619 family F420-dependent LLM class oxidoreductase [Pseudofrankia asymbiotica]ONH22893.1 hypothetical protein BL253_34520 [Pseudofrankia asymbiotica]
MRYSLSLFPLDGWSSLDEIVEVVRRAETLGFFGVGLAEHLVTPLESQSGREAATPGAFWVDNFAFGAVLARATSRLRLMLSALIVPYRHPLHAARSVATLDWVSDGRLDVTTGVGWLAPEFAALGIPFAERGARTDDALRAMVSLWTEEHPSYHGRFFSFSDLSFGRGCVQRPHVPLLIGGGGPAALRRVVEFGAGWAPMLATPETVRVGMAQLADELGAAGRDAADLRVFTRIAILGGNQAMRRALDSHPPSGARAPVGSIAASALDSSASQQVIDAVSRYVEAGVTEIGLSFPWRDAAEYVDRLEWFAAEVMPATAGWPAGHAGR